MKTWERALVGPDTTLREALTIIDQVGSQMALVVDANRRLLGTLSDGDVRRGLLKGLTLTEKVSSAMYLTPTVARAGEDVEVIIATMRSLGLHQMPIVTSEGIVVGMEVINDFLTTPTRDSWVVVMAGGLGTRLEQLTRDVPKPMLRVGSRPLLETILRGLSDQGFRHFYLAVNYLADQIEAHFGDGSRFGVDIHYLREQRRMGTAGALSLLPSRPAHPLVVTNADLLTKVDFGEMVDAHIAGQSDATMAVRDYEMQVPFGVVREVAGEITAIEEKPIQRFTVSAGIYVLSPQVLDLVPADTFFDMPSLFETVRMQGLRSRSHRIEGYWLDIGRMHDYERANIEFDEVFPVIGGKKVLALIAARGGSKGLPGKNILPLGGLPLVVWTVRAARASRYVDHTVLSSDAADIIDAAVAAGCEAPFVRDAALATDDASSMDVVADALTRVPGYDIVVLLQPTSPLRTADDIDGALELMMSSGAPACVSLCPAAEHPYWTFRRDDKGMLSRFAEPPGGMPTRRQDLPAAWCLNGAVYAARVDWFAGQRRFLADETVGFPMPAERSQDIDTREDFERIKSIMEKSRLEAGQ